MCIHINTYPSVYTHTHIEGEKEREECCCNIIDTFLVGTTVQMIVQKDLREDWLDGLEWRFHSQRTGQKRVIWNDGNRGFFFKLSKCFLSCQLLGFEGETLPTLKSVTNLDWHEECYNFSMQILRCFTRLKFRPRVHLNTCSEVGRCLSTMPYCNVVLFVCLFFFSSVYNNK